MPNKKTLTPVSLIGEVGPDGKLIEFSSKTFEAEPSQTFDVPDSFEITEEMQLNHLVEVREVFTVENRDAANWVVRKYSEAKKYVKDTKDWASKEVKRAEQAMAFYESRYGGQLAWFLRREIDSGRVKTKSLSLPAGKIAFRSKSLNLEILDEIALEEWAAANLPSAIRLTLTIEPRTVEDLEEFTEQLTRIITLPDTFATLKREVKKSALLEWFKSQWGQEDCEIPDGCDVTGGEGSEDSFSIQ